MDIWLERVISLARWEWGFVLSDWLYSEGRGYRLACLCSRCCWGWGEVHWFIVGLIIGRYWVGWMSVAFIRYLLRFPPLFEHIVGNMLTSRWVVFVGSFSKNSGDLRYSPGILRGRHAAFVRRHIVANFRTPTLKS